MATADSLPPDPLTLLRRSIAADSSPIPTSSPEPTSQAQSNVTLAQASYLIFNFSSPDQGAQHIATPLTQETRFISPAAGNKAIDLRSVYFAWLNKDSNTAEYIAALQTLNNELQQAGKNETATNLVFAEKLDLVTWLAGEIAEHASEYIKSADDNKQTRLELDDALRAVHGDGDVEMGDAGADATKRREEQDRLRAIYAAERKMGDHNTVLRGTKAQDFSSVRKYSALFLGKASTTNAPTTAPTQPNGRPNPTSLTPNPTLRPNPNPPKSSTRRPEPIILLSPSASSLLRMANIKPFLEDGIYTPLTPGAENPSMLAISRVLSHLNPSTSTATQTISTPNHSQRPTRFLLLDDTTHFRPDYWPRVVAVFTTGQTWQFKTYKWTQPAELFAHALGVYVGWRGEAVPETVRGWGRQVLCVGVDKGAGQRWRDREVVEEIWGSIEARMRAGGWGR